jgi:hypothetical protein
MHRDEVSAPRRGSEHGTSSATRRGKFAVPDPRNSRDVALSFNSHEWQTLTKVQAMAPYSLGAWAAGPTRR